MSGAYDVIREFERDMEIFTGAPCAVAVDSCSNAMELALRQPRIQGWKGQDIVCPCVTYPSAANALVHAGFKIQFAEMDWQEDGWYQFYPLPVVDAAKKLTRGMYTEIGVKMTTAPLVCLSFHGKKTLPIGRGGMILCTFDEEAEWFRRARFDGRHECALPEDTLEFPGWNCYMTPEQAARGRMLLPFIGNGRVCSQDSYQDLSGYDFYLKANR